MSEKTYILRDSNNRYFQEGPTDDDGRFVMRLPATWVESCNKATVMDGLTASDLMVFWTVKNDHWCEVLEVDVAPGLGNLICAGPELRHSVVLDPNGRAPQSLVPVGSQTCVWEVDQDGLLLRRTPRREPVRAVPPDSSTTTNWEELFLRRLEEIREYQWDGDNSWKVSEEVGDKPGLRPGEPLLRGLARLMADVVRAESRGRSPALTPGSPREHTEIHYPG